ncbi:MAG: TIGR00730 family Rossman fold protein [Gammaproteobacteria bacterium]|nr:TIGR00730 family Rossman fold protein [Gammaproteobacteria bacterium]
MNRICVYCGSSPGRRAGYLQAASALGHELVKRGIGLVYGGGSIGMMGRVADTVLDGGGEVVGVIPRRLFREEVVHTGLSELKVVRNMHERKALMMDLADGFIAMPGGLGTLEELFEILAWAKLRIHRKPCAILNACGYYDGLAALLNQVVAEGFAKPLHRDLLIIEEQPARLMRRMSDASAGESSTPGAGVPQPREDGKS